MALKIPMVVLLIVILAYDDHGSIIIIIINWYYCGTVQFRFKLNCTYLILIPYGEKYRNAIFLDKNFISAFSTTSIIKSPEYTIISNYQPWNVWLWNIYKQPDEHFCVQKSIIILSE